MDEFLRYARNALNDLSNFTTIHVVIGNEACDLDSTVSALVYAFYLNQTCQEKTTLFVPVLNIPRTLYRLRTETTHLLHKFGIADDLLTFEPEVDFDATRDEGRLRITLVDHHVLTNRLSRFTEHVVTILDHRPRETEITVADCVVELVGSCSTLVAERILNDKHFTLDSVSATLLCATILTDTIKFSPEAGKTTPKDVEIVQRLRTLLPELDTESLYDEIQMAKFDLSGLTAMELLEKDCKMLSGQGLTIAMCSVTMEMKELLQKDGLLESLLEFSNMKSASVVIVMTLVTSSDGQPQRQLAVYSVSRIYRHQIADVLLSSQDPPLQLENMESGLKNILVFHQGNAQASRKKVLPILKSFLSGEKTPDDGSKLTLDLLSSTNENDFSAVGTFTKTLVDRVELSTDESSNLEFYELGDNSSLVFTPVPSDASSGPVLSPDTVASRFDSLLVDLENKSSTESERMFKDPDSKSSSTESERVCKDPDSNSNRCQSLSTTTIITDLNTTVVNAVQPSGVDVNTNEFNSSVSISGNSSTASPDSSDSCDQQQQVDNKTVSVLNVGDENEEPSEFVDNNLMAFDEEDTFEFTDSDLQPGHVGFYLSSDSPMEVSSEANSGQGSKVSSYPVTPPNSYMDPGVELEFVDRSLPSFNSSEMAQRLRAKQVSMDGAEGAGSIDVVKDDSCEDTDNGVGEPYTPQNSYSDSSANATKETEIPCFNPSDMVRKINDKRASLKNADDVDVEKVGGDANDALFPWTPFNSMNDAAFDVGYKRNVSDVSEIETFGGKREKQGTGSEVNLEAGTPVMAVHSGQVESASFRTDRQTDLDKVVHRLSEVGMNEDEIKDRFLEMDRMFSRDADGPGNDPFSLNGPGNDPFSLNGPGNASKSSGNVVAQQIAEEMAENVMISSEGKRSEKGADLKMVSSNVVAEQISKEIISELKDRSHDQKVIEDFSGNVVVKQIAEDMVRENEILTENLRCMKQQALNKSSGNEIAISSDKRITEDCEIFKETKNMGGVENVVATEGKEYVSGVGKNWDLLKNSDNVVAKEIAQQMAENSEYFHGANKTELNAVSDNSSLISFTDDKRNLCAISDGEKNVLSVYEQESRECVNVVAEDIADQMVTDQNEFGDKLNEAGANCDQNIKAGEECLTEQSEYIKSKCTGETRGDNSCDQSKGGNCVGQSMGCNSSEQCVGSNSVGQSMGGNSVEKTLEGSSVKQPQGDNSVKQSMGGNSVEQSLQGNCADHKLGDKSIEQSTGHNSAHGTHLDSDTSTNRVVKLSNTTEAAGNSLNFSNTTEPTGNTTEPTGNSLNFSNITEHAGNSLNFSNITEPAGNSLNLSNITEPAGNSLNLSNITEPAGNSLNLSNITEPTGNSLNLSNITEPTGNSLNLSNITEPTGNSLNLSNITEPTGNSLNLSNITEHAGNSLNLSNITEPTGNSLNLSNITEPTGNSLNLSNITEPTGNSLNLSNITEPTGNSLNLSNITEHAGNSLNLSNITEPTGNSLNLSNITEPTGNSLKLSNTTEPAGNSLKLSNTTEPAGNTTEASSNSLSETDLAESAVLEVAFNLSNELIQEALETFSLDAPDRTGGERRRGRGAGRKLTKRYNGSDYSIETEYLPEMDPLHGGLDISQDSHLITTDAGREVVEGASFRKISGQTQLDRHQDMLRRMERSEGCKTKMANHPEEGAGEGSAEVLVGSRAENGAGNTAAGTENDAKEAESDAGRNEISDKEIVNCDLTDEAKGDFGLSNINAGVIKIGAGKTEVNSDEAENNATRTEIVDVDTENSSVESEKDTENVSDESSSDDGVHKLIHVPSDLASSIHESIEGDFDKNDISDDFDDSRFRKKVIHLEKEIDFDSSIGTDASLLSESFTDVPCLPRDAAETILDQSSTASDNKGHNSTDFISKGDNSGNATSELHQQKPDGDCSSSQTQGKGHNSSSVSSLEAKDGAIPKVLSEKGSNSAGPGKSMAERPQTLRTYSHTKEKRRIVPDADLLEDDGESSDSYLRASTDDVETPDDLDLHGDMDENALGELEWENDTPVRTSEDNDCEPLEEYSEEDERNDARNWKTVRLGDRQFRIDLKVIEPYKKVLSHGGYYGDGLNAIILFSGCYLPDRRRKDYHYVMDNLFYYVVHTLEQLVAEDYMIIYFHGATPKKQMPSFNWMKKCYQMIDRRLRKNLKALLLVHPTIWLKTVVMMTRPFISSKFSAKLRFVRTVDDLRKLVPMEYVYIPDQVQAYDDHLMNRPHPPKPSSSP